ncbi:ABC transporter ATP-binding protein [Roseibium sp. RKSG952]|uniref:ABC transporter ATP-binding protein n=1 Tax=Roseibium sp. RKSG952 TaxID=2529384 RepID=UPI0012BB551D|nr:ABC transporter ATP-binding protein [Roseibium sp. RKSG952]MTH97019.1 ABC transporter ATP-binding protein [Roseibium sp. RKSG952]
MTSIECRALGVLRNARPVLEDISFRANGGELIGVIGPNGAGKSTLLRAMAGLLPSSGEILWDGGPIKTVPRAERARRLAYMPQEREVHWSLPCRDVVLLGRLPHQSRLAGPSASDRKIALETMDCMDVARFADRAFDTLSGGEQARVLIARMLAQQPQAILADEPVNGLDPAHQIGLMQTFHALARGGQAVLVSLHDLTLAGQWCDRLLVLSNGRLCADAAPREVYAGPLLREIYGIETLPVEINGMPSVIPYKTVS